MIVRKYYQPDAPDPVLPDEMVLSLARRHLPRLEMVTAIDESGGEARTYYLDQHYVLKVQRPQQLRSWTSLAKEVRFLRQIALDDPTLPVPRVEGYGQEGDVEYTLMTRMGGDAAVRTTIPAGARQSMLTELGRVVRRVHEIQQEPLLKSGLFPEEHTPEDLRAALAEDVDEYAGLFENRGIGWPFPFSPAELIARAQEQVPDDTPAVALHTNPGPTHTFVDPQTGAFVGLIDFGDAYIGHPAHDLGRWPDPTDRAAVLSGYREAGEPAPGFFAFWPVATVLADLLVMLRYETKRAAAREDLLGVVEGWAR